MNKDGFKYVVQRCYHEAVPEIKTALIGASVLSCIVGFFYLLGTYGDLKQIMNYFLMVIIGSFLSYATGRLVKAVWKDWKQRR